MRMNFPGENLVCFWKDGDDDDGIVSFRRGVDLEDPPEAMLRDVLD
jgi:hypothetical protein